MIMARTAAFFWLVGIAGVLSSAGAEVSEQLDPSSAVSFYVAAMDLSQIGSCIPPFAIMPLHALYNALQWSTVDESFRTELASATESFCAHSLEECNVNPSTSLSLSVDNVIHLTGFPLEVENNLQIVFGVGLSSEQAISSPAFIPPAQLMSTILINQASLQSKAGSLLGQITLYYEAPASSPSPTPTAPPLDTVIDNAILIIVDQAPLTQWQEGSLEELFRQAVAEVANDYCTSDPASCSIDDSTASSRRRRSEDSVFDDSSAYVIPDYPQAITDSQLEIAFAISLPSTVTLVSGVTDYFIPQSSLLSLGLTLSPVLAELSGAYIIGISAYHPTKLPRTTSLWSQIGAGVTVPSVLLTLLLLIALIGLPILWRKAKRNKERYNVDNYVGGISKQVEIVNYRQHPMEVEDNPTEQQEEEGSEREEIRDCEEHYYERIMGEESNVGSEDSDVFQVHHPLDSH